MNKSLVNIQALHEPDEIVRVKNFLHRVYVVEMDWTPPEGNPSDQLTTTVNGLSVLQDRYDEVSQWFGAYSFSGQIIGCCRICTRLDGFFEAENYKKLPGVILQQNPLYEFNRFAVEKGQAENMIFCGFMETIFRLALKQDFTFFSTTGMNNHEMFEKIGMRIFDQEKPFKYYPTDPNTVSFTYFMEDEKQHILDICNKVLNSG